jgi:solute carrier family 35 protein E1
MASSPESVPPALSLQQDSSSTTNIPYHANLLMALNLSLWFLISSYYNIYNKRALNQLAMPWTVATIQMGTGMLIFIPLWLTKLRELPATSLAQWKSLGRRLFIVAIFTTLSHIAGVVSLGLGSVSFVQVVKAAEPFFTAFISMIWMKEFLPLSAYLSMIPVIVGVVLASVSELQFSWVCLLSGSLSNMFAGARSVFGKNQMKKSKLDEIINQEQSKDNLEESSDGRHLSAANYYSVLTLISFLVCIPLCLLIEGRQIVNIFKKCIQQTISEQEVNGLVNAVLSGLMHYLYNEMSFRVLSEMNSVSHALANTIKRVAVIALSVMVFGTEISNAGIIGSTVAIMGALLYSLVVGRK